MLLVSVSSLMAQGPPAPPLTAKELIDVLKSKQERPQAASIVERRGVSFELTPEIEKQLRKAKADDMLIETVKKASPSARAAQAAASGAVVATPEERQDMATIQNELDPDRAIQLVKDFETKYPNSQLLTWAYAYAASHYRQKDDMQHVLEYGDKSLKLKSDNLISLIIMAQNLPRPQNMKVSEDEKERILGKAESYAQEALRQIAALPKQPGETDEEFQRRTTQLAQDMHSALGMVHLQRSQLALEGLDSDELRKAEQEYMIAVTGGDSADPQDFFRLGETRTLLKNYDGAIEAFSKASQLGQGTVIKTYADQRIEAVQKMKAQAGTK
jgi:tetratricopeptide (TPR) repeat protein